MMRSVYVSGVPASLRSRVRLPDATARGLRSPVGERDEREFRLPEPGPPEDDTRGDPDGSRHSPVTSNSATMPSAACGMPVSRSGKKQIAA